MNSLAFLFSIKLFNFNFYLFLLFRFFLFSLFILSSIFYRLQSRNLRYLYFTKILSPNYQVHANHLLYSSFEAANSSSPSYASSHVGLLGPTYIPTRIQGCPAHRKRRSLWQGCWYVGWGIRGWWRVCYLRWRVEKMIGAIFARLLFWSKTACLYIFLACTLVMVFDELFGVLLILWWWLT